MHCSDPADDVTDTMPRIPAITHESTRLKAWLSDASSSPPLTTLSTRRLLRKRRYSIRTTRTAIRENRTDALSLKKQRAFLLASISTPLIPRTSLLC